MERKRILLLGDNPYLGGVTSHLLSVADALCDHPEFEVRLACLPGKNDDRTLVARGEELGQTVHVFPMTSTFDTRVLGALRRYVDEQRIDLIHMHGYRGILIAALAFKNRPAPVTVSTCHGVIVMPSARTRLWQWAALRAMRKHDRVIACAGCVRDWLVEYRVPPEKTTVIHNSFSPRSLEITGDCPQLILLSERISDVHPSRAQSDGLRLVFVGRLVPGKGLDVLLDALRGMSGVSLTVVGEGPLRNPLEAQARRLGLDVHFAGPVAEPAPHYLAADAVVLPSEMEALPMVLIEAAAYGKPVVACATGGIPEVVEDERSGLLVPPRNAEALRQALERMKALETREAMAARAKEVWREKFSPAVMGGHLAEVYRDALACIVRTDFGRTTKRPNP